MKRKSVSMRIAAAAEKKFGTAVEKGRVPVIMPNPGPVFIDENGKEAHLPPLDPKHPLALACKKALKASKESMPTWEEIFAKYGKTDPATGIRYVLTYDADIPELIIQQIG